MRKAPINLSLLMLSPTRQLHPLSTRSGSIRMRRVAPLLLRALSLGVIRHQLRHDLRMPLQSSIAAMFRLHSNICTLQLLSLPLPRQQRRGQRLRNSHRMRRFYLSKIV